MKDYESSVKLDCYCEDWKYGVLLNIEVRSGWPSKCGIKDTDKGKRDGSGGEVLGAWVEASGRAENGWCGEEGFCSYFAPKRAFRGREKAIFVFSTEHCNPLFFGHFSIFS